MRTLHALSDGLRRLGRRPRAGGTSHHRNPPGYRLARLENLEDRRMLNLGDLLYTLDDPDPQDPAVFGYAVAADGTPPTVTGGTGGGEKTGQV